jgi:diguanylate cyclase (GGDEF)-like protein
MPFEIGMIGRSFPNGIIISRLKESPQGSFEAESPNDGVRRQIAYQRAGAWPVAVGVGLSVADIYESWRQEAWSLGLIVFALCVFNIALVAFLAYSLQRRAAAERDLAVMATTDSLTGLCNRRRFDEVMDNEWRRAQREHKNVAMLLIDIDHFKKYNDEFGHQTGDIVLAAIARDIAAHTQRAADIAARFGGEEFAVLLPGVSAQEAFDHAERIRTGVLALPMPKDGPDVSPTVSIGVATMSPRAGLSIGDLVKSADAALYEAKAAGRNRCVQAAIPASAVRLAA